MRTLPATLLMAISALAALGCKDPDSLAGPLEERPCLGPDVMDEGDAGERGDEDGQQGGDREPQGEDPPPVPELTLPLTIEGVVEHVRRHDISNVNTLVAALPRLVRQNYVFMETSRSRHHATAERPRMILFTPTARFLLAVSSNEADPLYETVEMAELSADTGEWRFEALQLTDLARSGGPERCGPCHGVPTQPLWGSYPEWPGALGDDGGQLRPEQFRMLTELRTNEATRERFRSIPFELRDDLQAFSLPNRSYDYPNTVFNFDLGRAVATGLHTRLAKSEDYARLSVELLLSQQCVGRTSVEYSTEDVLLRAGIEPRQFYLQEPYVAPFDFYLQGDRGWNSGTTSLLEFVEFLALDTLLTRQPSLAPYFAAVEGARSAILANGFGLDDAAWAQAAASDSAYNYFDVPTDVLRPVFEGADAGALCAELEQLVL